MSQYSNLENSIQLWINAIGKESVLTDQGSIDSYVKNTEGIIRKVSAILRPQNREQLIAIVIIANSNKIPLHPISTGNNWGYGTACPVSEHCVIVDLKAMNRIIDFDSDLGVVKVEPGVTQQDLYEYLQKHNYPYIVPTTGAGPRCSVLANALERGFGITPHVDHFGAVMGLEAILPDGTLYQSPYVEMGAPETNNIYKWGIGPYTDGLFSQSNLGIVISMNIGLAPKTEIIETFYFTISNQAQLDGAVRGIREVMKQCKSLVSGINLMNSKRVLAMKGGLLFNQYKASDEEDEAEMLKRLEISPWSGIGVIYTNGEMIHSVKKFIKKQLSTHCDQLVFFSLNKIHTLKKVFSFLPFKTFQKQRETLSIMEKGLEIFHGIPNQVALQIAYNKNPNPPKETHQLNPSQDGCGLIWYSPLIAMKEERVKEYIEMVTKICNENCIEPLITLTALSDKFFDSTVPILFDNPPDLENARSCYEALFARGKELGFLPYRMSSQYMKLFLKDESAHWRFVRSIKQAIDPNNIISPGRYTIT